MLIYPPQSGPLTLNAHGWVSLEINARFTLSRLSDCVSVSLIANAVGKIMLIRALYPESL